MTSTADPDEAQAVSLRGGGAVRVAGRATYVPHGTDKSGTERTTTVTDMWLVTWLPGAPSCLNASRECAS